MIDTSELAALSGDAFENKRTALIHAHIKKLAAGDEDKERRLRVFQWRLDGLRHRYKSDNDGLMREMAAMMTEQVGRLGAKWKELSEAAIKMQSELNKLPETGK